MAISRVKTWSSGEVLTAADQNAEFNNILNNPVDLFSPAGKSVDMNGFELVMDADGDSSITADTDDRLDFRLGGTDLFRLNAVASAVNGLDFVASTTTVSPGIQPFGTDTNISMVLDAKGTGGIVLRDGNDNEVFITAAGIASAVNEITITNAATGNNPILEPTGGDTDISLTIRGKGAGGLDLTSAPLQGASPLVFEGSTSDGFETTLAITDPTADRTVTIVDADITPTGRTLATEQASTSGTTIDFTSIPSWVTKITMMLDGVSTDGASTLLVQIGDSGGFETTGYRAMAWGTGDVGQTATTGFILRGGTVTAASINDGTVIMTLMDTSNTWCYTGTIYQSVTASVVDTFGGRKALSGTLDRVRLTTSLADTFDAGSVNIMYE